MKSFVKILLLFLLFFLTSGLYAEEILTVDDNFSEINLGKYLYYYSDDTSSLGFDQILKKNDNEFIKFNKKYYSFGYSHSTFWFKITVNNLRNNPDWFVEYLYPIIDEIDLYYKDKKSGKIVHNISGDRRVFNKRVIDYMTSIFPIKGQKGLNTLYFKIKSQGSLTISFKGWVSKDYFAKKKETLLFKLIFYGIIISFIFYNLFNYLSFKENSFIYLIFLSFFAMLYSLVDSGFAFQLLWPNSTNWANIIHSISLALFVGFANQFTREFINYKIKYPRVDRLQKCFFIIGLFLAVISFFIPYHYSTRIVTLYVLFSMILLIIIGVVFASIGFKRAFYLMLAWAVMLLMGIFSTLRAFGIVLFDLTSDFSVQFGVIAAIFLLNIGVIKKINKIKQDLLESNATLEKKVEKRTIELQQAVDEMEQVNEFLNITNEKLQKIHLELEQDMKMAGNLQKRFLPEKNIELDGWDIAIFLNPLMNVSGDFYDLFVNNGKLKGVGLFDVSGHGVSSGLLTLMAKSIFERKFKRGLKENLDLNEIVKNVNEILLLELADVDNYITGVIVKIIDDTIEYVNAGHVDIFHGSSKNKKVSRVISNEKNDEFSGMFLGMKGMDFPYYKKEFKIEMGDSILFFSDCLLESRNVDGKIYGYDRIEKEFFRSIDFSAEKIKNNILKDFNQFTNGRELEDDLTVLVIKKQK